METTTVTLRVDNRMFFKNVDLIIPVEVEEMVSETDTTSRGV
jgi:hypothetical protein